ncbi:hypothetical protein LO772_15340 [Yinghuangia sp. ASG 101]|uniref:DUF6879 family protein n=1 Tax=Yinghuangia sp. ASG 101 TaxID=2896848 RepID=UPI001E4F2B31|nr:DUF6879 family protein [Yinghuangia sp. ASG 101]UGQ14819.1 hypothetical protein LO772_15340 [Yinghuangia sp. ASG 101]
MSPNAPLDDMPFAERLSGLMATARSFAVHWETRDSYAVDGEDEDFEAWRVGRVSDEEEAAWWAPFLDDVVAATGRGVVFRRLRVVSEPVSAYIRYEHVGTGQNVKAGEQVRWLPRAGAHDLWLPALDGWVFDGEVLLLHHFAGDNRMTGHELMRDAVRADAYMRVFERLWEQATPHEKYRIG